MNKRSASLPRRLLAAAALAAATWSAPAVAGISVSPEQVLVLKAGMTEQEVTTLIGQPARRFQFAAANGTTWRYDIASATGPSDLLIDFDKAGKVVSVVQMTDLTGG